MMVIYKLLYHCRLLPYSNYVVGHVALFPSFLPKRLVVMSIYVLICVCPLLGRIFFTYEHYEASFYEKANIIFM